MWAIATMARKAFGQVGRLSQVERIKDEGEGLWMYGPNTLCAAYLLVEMGILHDMSALVLLLKNRRARLCTNLHPYKR